MLGLQANGYNITIVSTEKSGNEELIGILKERLRQAGIKWYFITYTKSPIIFSTVYDILRMNRLCRKLMKEIRFDAIHCRSYIVALIGNSFKKKYGIPFIFDMRGFFADERIDGGIWNQKSFIYRLVYRYFKEREATFLTNADYTICITYEARREIHTWRSIAGQPLPIEVIPCCSDSVMFDYKAVDPLQQDKTRKELHINTSDFILTYVGAVGTWYMLDEMLDFFKRLSGEYTSAKFLFITAEDPKNILAKAAGKGIDTSKLIIKKVPYRDVPLYLSLSTVSIFFIKPLYSKKASSPTKLGEIMHMGIPIICNSHVGDTDKIITETGAGAIVRTFNTDDYDYLISRIPDLLSVPKEQIRNAAIMIFGLEKGVQKYKTVYDRVIHS